MSPRTSLIKTFSSLTISSPFAQPVPFLVPFLQHRSSSILSSLSENRDAYNKRIRRGRGPASGKGKTSGRGHKGQKQHGKVPAGFNGGQTPDSIVSPPRGAPNLFALDLSPLNVDRLQEWIDQDRLDPSQPITLKELVKSRCVHSVKDGIKLLARGSETLRTPVNIVVSRASATAINAVENAGGTIMTRFYTPTSIKRVLRGETDPIFSLQSSPAELSSENAKESYPYRLPDPTSRKDIEYYRDPAHRGYLNYQVIEGQGPSLFYRSTGEGSGAQRKAVKKNTTSHSSENRIW